MLDCMVSDCNAKKDDADSLNNLLTNIMLLCSVKFGVDVEIENPNECPTTSDSPTTCPSGNICDGLMSGDFFLVRFLSLRKVFTVMFEISL